MNIKKEIAKIHVLKKLYQLTEEELYLHVQVWTGSDSISKLTKVQAWTVIKTLEAKYNPQKPKPRRHTTIRSNSNVIALMTPDQREYLEDLIGKINRSTVYVLTIEGMAQRQFKKSEKLLTRNDARILTEAAKSILDRVSNPKPRTDNND